MSRLKKLALGGNIQSGDVTFIVNDDSIIMNLIDQEKKMHAGPWSGEYFNIDDESVIGGIQYQIDGNPLIYSDDGSQVEMPGYTQVHVEYLEVREEYRSTRVVMYLFEQFQSQVLQPLIDFYGYKRIFVTASFANAKLQSFLERRIDQYGLKLNPAKEELDEETHNEYDVDNIGKYDKYDYDKWDNKVANVIKRLKKRVSI